MHLINLRYFVFSALVGASAATHALELRDVAKAAQCNDKAAKAVTAALTTKPPKWLYLVEESPYFGDVLGTKRDIHAFGTTFRKFHWHATQVMNVVSLLMEGSQMESFIEAQQMKPLPGSIMNLHYRVEPDGRFTTISQRLDAFGKPLGDAIVRCVDGYKDEGEFISKSLESEELIKDLAELNRASKQE